MNPVLAVLLALLVVSLILLLLAVRTVVRRRNAAVMADTVQRLVSSGQVDEARGLVERAARRSVRDPGERYAGIRAASALGDHDRVLELLDRGGSGVLPLGARGRRIVRDLRRTDDQLRHRTLVAAGRSNEAAAWLDEATQRDPEAPWLRSWRFIEAVWSDRPSAVEAARPAALTALAEHPLDPDLVLALATDALARYRIEAADRTVGAFLEAVASAEQDARRRSVGTFRPAPVPSGIYVLRGVVRSALGDDAGAEVAFEEAIERSAQPDTRSLIAAVRGSGLVLRGDLEAALEAFDSFLATREKASVSVDAAACRLRLGRLDEAARDLASARRAGVEERLVRPLEARLHAARGRCDDARRAIDDLGPELADEPVFAVAYVRVVCGHPDAEDALRRYAAYAPDDPELPPLMDRVAPDGRTWREHLEQPSGRDREVEGGGSSPDP